MRPAIRPTNTDNTTLVDQRTSISIPSPAKPRLIASFGGYMPSYTNPRSTFRRSSSCSAPDTNDHDPPLSALYHRRFRSACRRFRRDRQGHRHRAGRRPAPGHLHRRQGRRHRDPQPESVQSEPAHGPLAGAPPSAAQTRSTPTTSSAASPRSRSKAVRRHQADRPAADRRRRFGRQERAERRSSRSRTAAATIVVKFDWKPTSGTSLTFPASAT